MKGSAWAIVLCLAGCMPAAAAIPAPTEGREWRLYPAACQGGTAAVEFACGTYGRYLISPVEAPDCTPLAQGVETAPGYGVHLMPAIFPIQARRLPDLVGHTLPAFTSEASVLTSVTGAGGRVATAVPVPPPPPSDRWIAVLDFEGAHGDSTAWLAGEVAGSSVTPALVPLQSPELEPLGDVADFHVLAALCAVAEVVDSGELPVPVAVNMSFGRTVRASDPVSAACSGNVACEIAKVVHHLRTEGTTPVAAAGNHGEAMFPGSLDEVVSAGMLDLTPFFEKNLTRAAWETPAEADAWIPGSALCLGGFAAPAGSSYSSAMLAGWLVRVLDHPDVLASLGTGMWVPVWNASKGCYVLGKDNNGIKKPTPYCNLTISALFQNLSGSAAPCWSAASEPSLLAPAISRSSPPAPLPSIERQGAPTHPAPESDPCVPCSGVMVLSTSGTDLVLDLSASGSLAEGVTFDEIDLRVNDTYLPLSLTEAELADFAAGALARVVVPDVASLIPADASVSLWYRLKDDPDKVCDTEQGCFWTSTPVLIDK